MWCFCCICFSLLISIISPLEGYGLRIVDYLHLGDINPAIMGANHDNGPPIGIDIGTLFSCVGVWLNGKVEIIANVLGNRSTPSCVAFNDEQLLLGEAAFDQAGINPENTIYDAKRLVGRKFDDPHVQNDMKIWPFKIINDVGNPVIKVRYHGENQQFYPQQILSMVVSMMKEIAEGFIGKGVRNAVIAVPAYFNDSQRQATKDAGRIAGLNVLQIVNEPTAAALAYGLERKHEDSTILIFDMGGGTLNVSILAVKNGLFEVKATSGNTHLGGVDFDTCLLKNMICEFNKKNGKDMSCDKRAIRRLRTACEHAKRVLSTSKVAFIEVDSLFEGVDFRTSLSLARFHHLCGDLFKAILVPVERILDECGIGKHSVNEIVLVGGATHMPKVQSILKEFFDGIPLNKSINPDEAVAHGATMMAAIIQNERTEGVRDVWCLDVTPLSLGVEVDKGTMFVIIPRNTAYPTKRYETFTTSKNNQKSVNIKVYEGQRLFASDNNLLVEFELPGIPLKQCGVPRIEVCFDIDSNGILSIYAVEQSTGKESSVTIRQSTGRLSASVVKAMIREAEFFKEEDKLRKICLESRNSLEDYVYRVSETLEAKTFRKKFSQLDYIHAKRKCSEVLDWLRRHRKDNTTSFQQKLKETEAICGPVILQLYKIPETKCLPDPVEELAKKTDEYIWVSGKNKIRLTRTAMIRITAAKAKRGDAGKSVNSGPLKKNDLAKPSSQLIECSSSSEKPVLSAESSCPITCFINSQESALTGVTNADSEHCDEDEDELQMINIVRASSFKEQSGKKTSDVSRKQHPWSHKALKPLPSIPEIQEQLSEENSNTGIDRSGSDFSHGQSTTTTTKTTTTTIGCNSEVLSPDAQFGATTTVECDSRAIGLDGQFATTTTTTTSTECDSKVIGQDIQFGMTLTKGCGSEQIGLDGQFGTSTTTTAIGCDAGETCPGGEFDTTTTTIIGHGSELIVLDGQFGTTTVGCDSEVIVPDSQFGTTATTAAMECDSEVIGPIACSIDSGQPSCTMALGMSVDQRSHTDSTCAEFSGSVSLPSLSNVQADESVSPPNPVNPPQMDPLSEIDTKPIHKRPSKMSRRLQPYIVPQPSDQPTLRSVFQTRRACVSRCPETSPRHPSPISSYAGKN